MLPTHPVPCPRCGKTLYWAVSLEGGVDAGSVESPRIEQDAAGHYMRCPHCGQRIAMRRLSTGSTEGSAEAWRPSM